MINLCFHHIPKTGGTSVINALVTAGMKHQAIRSDLYNQEVKIQPHINFISSHWYLKENRYPQAKHFTIYRNPIDVMFSFFFYMKKYKRKFHYHWMMDYYRFTINFCHDIEEYVNNYQWLYPKFMFNGEHSSIGTYNPLDHIGTLENINRTIEWFNSIDIPVDKFGHYHKSGIEDYQKQFPELYRKAESYFTTELKIWEKAYNQR